MTSVRSTVYTRTRSALSDLGIEFDAENGISDSYLMMIDSGFRLVKTDRYDKGEGPIIRSEFFRDRDQSFLFISMSSTSSTTTAAAAAPSNIVDINSLSIEELSSLQQQLNAELNFFNESLGELRNVSSKFGRCQVTLESINPQEKNKLTLIPLSESVNIFINI